MRTGSLVLLFLLSPQDRPERSERGTRGAAVPVDPARLERSYAEFALVAARGEADPDVALDEPFDSGLPACRSRDVRSVKRAVPPEMVGKTVLFAPSGEGIVFVTKAKRLRDAFGRLLATPEAIERFGVRCAPTTVHARKGELELREGEP
jgi:hypothetical protein